MVNNFDIITNLLKPETKNDFWFGQIIARRKDNPDLPRADRLIKSYYISNPDYLKEKENEIKSLCNIFNARFYLNPNVRDKKIISIALCRHILLGIQEDVYSSIQGKLDSVCGTCQVPDRIKYWILDIDGDTSQDMSKIDEFIRLIPPIGDKIILKYKTANGMHYITTPFNSKTFSDNIGKITDLDISVHKNSPALIYFNNDNIQK